MERPELEGEALGYAEFLEAENKRLTTTLANLTDEIASYTSDPVKEMYLAMKKQFRDITVDMRKTKVNIMDEDDKSYERVQKFMKESKTILENFIEIKRIAKEQGVDVDAEDESKIETSPESYAANRE
jgi:hypothetical protein